MSFRGLIPIALGGGLAYFLWSKKDPNPDEEKESTESSDEWIDKTPTEGSEESKNA